MCVCGLDVAFVCICAAVLMQAATLSNPNKLQMSAMEAIAAVIKKRCGNTKAKSVSDARVIVEARTKDLSDKRMHHKQSVTIPD